MSESGRDEAGGSPDAATRRRIVGEWDDRYDPGEFPVAAGRKPE